MDEHLFSSASVRAFDTDGTKAYVSISASPSQLVVMNVANPNDLQIVNAQDTWSGASEDVLLDGAPANPDIYVSQYKLAVQVYQEK